MPTLAIAGDTLFVGAGSVKFPPAGSAPAATPEGGETATPPPAQLIALRIGGAGEGTAPAATDATAEPVATEETAAAPTGEGVQVEMVDIAFVQTELTIPANTDVTLQFINSGVAVHNFKIDDPEVYSGDLANGQTSEVTVNLPAGTYTYYCTVPGHRDAGMLGTLTVE